MKPYLLTVHNFLRFSLKRIYECRNFNFAKIQMLSRKLYFKMDKNSRVRFGSHLVSDGYGRIFVDNGAVLKIGERVYFNSGINISCKKRIEIGKGCLFGPNVMLFDNNHKFDSVNGVSSDHTVGSIKIGDNCWIASNVVILKDTEIGNNCVIGAGCVVSGKISDGSMVIQDRKLIVKSIKDGNE